MFSLVKGKVARCYLAWSFHTLELGGNIFISASVPKEAQAVLGIFEFPEINEEDTNHGASAPFTSLAVHGNHILLILVHPVSHTATELQHVSVKIPGERLH